MPRYKLRPPSLLELTYAARWLRRLDDLGLEAGERDHCARIAQPAIWRTRNRLTSPLEPPHDDLGTWLSIGASDALARMDSRISTIYTGPAALAYAAGYVAIDTAYQDQTMPGPQHETTLHIPEGGLDPRLAAAWVKAARDAPILHRDATNKKTGHYTSADGVSAQARTVLANNDLLWAVVGDRISSPSLATCEIGSRSYVGDVSLDWMLVHDSGAVLRGTSTAAVVAMTATPHDKAVQAAKTYLSGNVLRSLLCFVREDKHSTDKRLDDEANPSFVACSPETQNAIGTLCGEIASLAGATRDDVFQAAWKGAGYTRNTEVEGPKHISPGEAIELHRWLVNDRKNFPTDDDQSAGGPS